MVLRRLCQSVVPFNDEKEPYDGDGDVKRVVASSDLMSTIYHGHWSLDTRPDNKNADNSFETWWKQKVTTAVIQVQNVGGQNTPVNYNLYRTLSTVQAPPSADQGYRSMYQARHPSVL